jgi:hydroxyacylglutathione hydrolase
MICEQLLSGHLELAEKTGAALRRHLAASDDPVIIDVRDPGAIGSGGAIAGARAIPMPRIVSEAVTLDPTRPTVVSCASGYRSSMVASVLAPRGFADVSDLIGGHAAWTAPAQDRS